MEAFSPRHSATSWRTTRSAGGGESIEALLALVLLAPLAGEEALRLEPSQQRIERPFVDRQAALGERLAQRVAVVLGAELAEHGEHQAAAPQLEAQVLEESGLGGVRGVRSRRHGSSQVVCEAQCVTHTV